MARQHLHELLKEDQEPFQLKSYIDDRRLQLKNKPTTRPTTLQVKKRKSIVEASASTSNRSVCKQACFSFSFHDSPDVRRSPLINFSPVKSPSKSPNTVFLHIPARTASLLLEAAMRIQKQQSSTCSSKPKSTKNVGFGLLGSLLRKLRDKNRTKKREIVGSEEVDENLVGVEDKIVHELGFSCNNSRLSSAGWSESNEEKSLDMDTSSSCSRSEDLEERENGGFDSCEKHFCSSPLSPFRFSLQRSPSDRSTPEFLSPAASPSRCIKQVRLDIWSYYEEQIDEAESLGKTQLEEEEKEQFSPVSVLDPPFEDDDEEREGGDEVEDEEEEDVYDLECSYAHMQRTKQQLLQKLRRFERLAELDPIELEKRMLEEQSDEDDDDHLVDDEECDCNDALFYSEEIVDTFVREVLSRSSFQHLRKIPGDMKRLVSDLIAEERKNCVDDNEVVTERVSKRLDSWKGVESNTIDMMVELDFRREIGGWKRYDQEQMGETAMEIELAIFGLLLEELSEELV
ncbi:hypothetical protein RJ640_030950 [Escallonia rubra]|uniref:DUF4378 domain-containing protein n=1 Tax=Escallonia rubra TaxID=112253 RepID=A0AA88UCU7_9ASTE|nr:hypothetical protein RJ640_030950 [Escallonia rubra]